MEFENKRVLITGGSRGIGRGVAEAFLERGAKVAITGRDEKVLNETAKAIGATAIQADAAVEDDCVRTVETAIRELGGLDVLINNAGIGGGWVPVTELTTEDFDRVFATNVRGAMMMGREAARHFVAQSSGHIVNVSSTAGTKGMQRGTEVLRAVGYEARVRGEG